MMTRDADDYRKQIVYFCIDDLVPANHLLRQIDKAIDWSFIYVVGWLSLREAWSIMENLSDMGLPMPQKVVETVRGELKKCQPKI